MHKLEFRKFVESLADGGGIIAQEVPPIGGTNAEFSKSQEQGEKLGIRSKYVAMMKRKMSKK